MPITSLSSLTTTPFVQLATPSTTGIVIMGIELFQETSEVSQQEIVTLMRRSTASTLPTSTTPIALAENDPASKLTGSTTTNATGIATVSGTAGNILLRVAFNVLNGLIYYPPDPRVLITVAPSSFLTMQFPTAPAANTWSGQIIFGELS
jgi:hypothetical protein